jgi:hypothetical protein
LNEGRGEGGGDLLSGFDFALVFLRRKKKRDGCSLSGLKKDRKNM